MSAPESVVASVMEEMGCWLYERPSGPVCYSRHEDLPNWTVRGCETAVEVADAAWAASLVAAAERFDERESEMRGARTLLAAGACKAASRTLRRWADESGA